MLLDTPYCQGDISAFSAEANHGFNCETSSLSLASSLAQAEFERINKTEAIMRLIIFILPPLRFIRRAIEFIKHTNPNVLLRRYNDML